MSVNIVFIDKYFKLLHEHFTRVCACTRVCTSNLCVVTCGVGGPSVGARAPGAELTERQRTQSLGSGAAERAASDVLLAAAGPPSGGGSGCTEPSVPRDAPFGVGVAGQERGSRPAGAVWTQGPPVPRG